MNDDTLVIVVGFLMLLIVVVGFILITLSIMRYCSVKNIEDIVAIEDLEMLVERKGIYGGSRPSHGLTMENRLYLRDPKDKSNKVMICVNRYDYEQYNEGYTIVVQKVFYKYKNKIYSEIKFAKKEDYNRLQEYLNRNDEDTESISSLLSKAKPVCSPIYGFVINTLVFIMFVLIFIYRLFC